MHQKSSVTMTLASLTLVLGLGVKVNFAAPMTAALTRCPPHHFLQTVTSDPGDGKAANKAGARCVACSACPADQIIRRPCTPHADTLCGPFSEFRFHSRPALAPPPGFAPPTSSQERQEEQQRIQDLLDELDQGADQHWSNTHDGGKEGGGGGGHAETHSSHNPHHNRRHHNRHGNTNDETRPLNLDPDHVPRVYPHFRSSAASGGSEAGAEAEVGLCGGGAGAGQWKVLALALIAVLAVVCVFLIGFVFVVCYMRSRRAHCKKVLYSAGTSPWAAASNRNTYVPVFTHGHGRGSSSGYGCGEGGTGGSRGEGRPGHEYVYFKTPPPSHSVHHV